jgi:REP element-mobilizing transposase RayT
MIDLPRRRTIRIKDYDYSQDGAYFVTACTQSHANIFGEIKQTTEDGRPFVELSALGKFVDETIRTANRGDVTIDRYVIMPNHIHLLIIISSDSGAISSDTGDRGRSPIRGVGLGQPPRSAVQNIVRSIKSYVTKWAGYPVWQRSFYEHVIRDDRDHFRVAEYIENNPSRWRFDKYYVNHG